MPAFSDLPGTIAPDELDTRAEWVHEQDGFLRSLASRLGSEPRVEKLVVAVLPPLRPLLRSDTWEALLDELPFALRGVVRSADAHLGGPPPRFEERSRYVAFVEHHAQQPDERAELSVIGVLGALRERLSPGLDDAVAQELPPEIAALWSAAGGRG